MAVFKKIYDLNWIKDIENSKVERNTNLHALKLSYEGIWQTVHKSEVINKLGKSQKMGFYRQNIITAFTLKILSFQNIHW